MKTNFNSNNIIAPTIKEIDDKFVLGYLYANGLSQINISPGQLRKLFKKNNLSDKFIGEIRSHDAFRRASSSVSQRRIDVLYNGTISTAKLEVDETKSDDDEIVRYLGRKIVNKADEELNYSKIAKIIFSREDESITFRINKKTAGEYNYKTILSEIRKKYEANVVEHNEKTLKNIINKMITSMHPVSIATGGQFKFVPVKYKEQLFNMQGLMTDLSEIAEGQQLEIIPVMNTEDLNMKILNAVNLNVKKELGEMEKEIEETIAGGGKFSVRSVNSYKEKFKFFKEELLIYEDLLHKSMGPLSKQLSKAVRLVDANISE